MTTKPSILIIGNGQLGSAFAELYGEDAQQATRKDIDLAVAMPQDYFRLLGQFQPNMVINTAAHTQVDKAESEKELAMKINGTAAGYLARACGEYGALLVHYSTDYVFHGSGDRPWVEADDTDPINHYGATKLAGEQAVIASGADYLIFRISWVFDAGHVNFVNTMLRLGAQREQLAVIDDQFGAPCYTADIAQATATILQHNRADIASGIYHMCNQGETSWHGFAEAIFALAKQHGQKLAVKEIRAIPSSQYPTPAKRPHNSRLDSSLLNEQFGVQLPSWQDALARCMERKYAC